MQQKKVIIFMITLNFYYHTLFDVDLANKPINN